MSTSTDALARYSRQVLFQLIGRHGQERLARSHVAIVGCGALGSAQASLLVRAGVGCLSIIDRDFVEESNLQRQILFDENDAAESRPKAIAAAHHLQRANSGVQVKPSVADLAPGNITDLLDGADFILDGTDNFETRYVINDFSIAHNVPWIYGAVVGASAVTFTIIPQLTACLECVFGSHPTGLADTCDTAGVLGWAVAFIASLQVSECIKWLTGNHDALRKTLFSADLWTNEYRELSPPPRNPECRACARADFVYLRGEKRPHVTLCGRDSVQIHEHDRQIEFAELERRLAPHGRVRYNEFVLKFWPPAIPHSPNGNTTKTTPGTTDFELTVFPDGRAIIKGTTDVTVARSLYARYIGS